MRRSIALLIALLCLFSHRNANANPVLAEAGAPVRTADHSINIKATIDVLHREQANTYLYQIWRCPGDWDQLPAFADAAKDAGIDVWVYLVPWSETPDKDPSFAYPLPFKTDYIAWGRAIGGLSVDHPGITAWVMDDFYINATQPDRFTDAYVDQMLAAGKSQNPNLRFFPVVYFQQPWADFVRRFSTKVDGVIACYPRSQHEINEASDYLNGNAFGPSLLTSLSRKAKVKAGAEAVAISQLRPPSGAHLRLYFDDQTFGGEAGAHTAFVRVNGHTLWSDHLGSGKEDEDVDLPLPDSPNGATIQVGLQIARMETGALVQARLDDIRVVTRDGQRIDSSWRAFANPGTNAELTPGSPGGGNLHIPMLLLVATHPGEHLKRYGEPPTLDNIQRKIHLAVDCLEHRQTAGVICWYTPKSSKSQILPLVTEEFSRVDPQLQTAITAP